MSSAEKPPSEQQSHQPDPVLMGLFNFSVDDLKANRAGNLTPRQIQLLGERIGDNWMALGCLPVLIAVFFICIFVMPTGKERSALNDAGILAAGIGVILWVVVSSINSLRRSRSEVAQPKIKSVQGNMQLHINEYKRVLSYWLMISYAEFNIKPSLYTGLAAYLKQKGHSRSYRVYYTDESKTILSIE